MFIWPLRPFAFLSSRCSAIASYASGEEYARSPPPGLLWFLCCFREAWPFRGAELELLDGPVKAGRRDSMLEVEGPPVWLLGEFDAMERDLPRFEFD